MKKLLSIALALVLAFALTVNVFAEEVIYSEDIMFFSASNWSQYTLDITVADFAAKLATPGAYVVITRSAPTDVVYADGGYEKFCMTDGWWSGNLGTDADGNTINTMRLGTGGHTIAVSPEFDVLLDCVLDDGVKVWYDAAAFLAQFESFTNGGSELLLISNTSSTAYDVVNISIVVPDEPIAAPEAPAEEEAPAEDTTTEAPAEDTTTEAPAVEETDAPAETGLALAVVPAVVALAAVVLSKKR